MTGVQTCALPIYGLPMQKMSKHTWRLTIERKVGLISYKYNRNNDGYSSDEEFVPDSPDTRRTFMVDESNTNIQDSVEKWRWLSSAPVQVKVQQVTSQKMTPKIVGIHLLDYHDPSFDEYIDTTFARLKKNGFEYVGVPWRVARIHSLDPLVIEKTPPETFQHVIDMAKKHNLTLMVWAHIETDPGDPLIRDQLKGVHSDAWNKEYVQEWESVLLDLAHFANKEPIGMIVLSNEWPLFSFDSEAQKMRVNALLTTAHKNLNKEYEGILTTDMFQNDSFTYYQELDWIGDKGWWKLTNKFNPSIEEIAAAAEKIIDERYVPAAHRFQKPIFIHSVAFGAYDGAAGARILNTELPEIAEWFPYDESYPLDLQEQAYAYEAVFRAIADEEIIVGVAAFGYKYWDSEDKSAGIRGKPAEDIWIYWNRLFKSTS